MRKRPGGRYVRKQKSRIKKAIVGLTVAFGLLMLATSGASATDQRVTRAKGLAQRQGAQHAKLMALQDLCDLDSNESRTAIRELANDPDDKTATHRDGPRRHCVSFALSWNSCP